MVKDSCIDYMHVVCLGVTKRLLNFWVTYKPGFKELSENFIDKILLFWPEEFQRKIRHVKYLNDYKASEFRTWVLYVGPAIMRFFLTEAEFNHFILLHHGLRCLFITPQSDSLLNEAQSCINKFLDLWPQIYPDMALTYVVHALEHLPEDCRYTQTTPDYFSAFKFESYLRRVKNNYHGGSRHIEQVRHSS